MPFKDPEKKREYRRKWYSQNKKSEIAHVRRRKIKIKKEIWEFKKSLSCSICGENHPATIEFHHKNPKDKEKAIAVMANDGLSIKRIMEEIKKCVVVCVNCHRKIHYKKRTQNI